MKLLLRSIAFLLVTGSLFAIPPFAEFYSENEANLPPFESGAFFPTLNGSGYQLSANSQVTSQPGETWPVSSLTRFDEDGKPLYSVFMDNQGDNSDQELTGDLDDTSRFFAGFLGQDGRAFLSIYQGETMTTDYSVATQLASAPLNADLTFFPGKIAALTQEAGTFIRVLTLDPTGKPLIDRDYMSPDLLGMELQGLSIQTENLSQLPDESGFFLSIHWSQIDFSNPLNFSRNNRFLLLRLDNAGAIQWTRSFDLDSGAVGLQDISAPIANNAYLYRLADTEVNGQTPTTHTKLIKINADGSLGFAKRIENVRLTSVAPAQTGDDLYLGGLMSNPANPIASDVVFLRMNAASGALNNAVTFDQAISETGAVAGVTENSVYVQIISFSDPNSLDIAGDSDLVRLNRNLGNPSGVRYRETGFGSFVVITDDELLFSPFDNEKNAVGALALDGNFKPLAAGCELFDAADLKNSDPGLDPTDMVLELKMANFTVREVGSTLTPANLPVTELTLETYQCGEGGQGNGDNDLQVTISLVEDGVQLTFPTAVGFNYDIQFTADLAQAFQSIMNRAGTGQEAVFLDTVETVQGFYEIVVNPVQ